MEKARILQINANYGFGSTGLIMKDIDELISRQPDLESFVAFQRSNAKKESGIKIGNSVDWKLHALFSRILGRQGFYSGNTTKRFTSTIDKIRPDIVHLHNLHSNYVNIEILLNYLAKKDIPVIITMHDCWWFTGKCFHYIDVNCNKFKIGCGGCPKRKAPPASLFFDRSGNVYQHKKSALLAIPRLTMVGCSDWICNEAKKSFLNGVDITRIYNGIDTSVFRPLPTTRKSNFTVLGMANKWLSERNKDLIPKILKETTSDITLVGCSESQQNYLHQYGSRISSLGFISDRDELAKIYNSADVFINVTHADTLPTVNMEAICCGTPVITYNSTGSPELVGPETGFIVEEDDQQQIVDLINHAQLPDRKMCSAVGKQSFNKDNCYQGYINLYRTILKK